MKTFRTETQEVQICDSVVCNGCGKAVAHAMCDNYLNVNYKGGYGSKLGDGTHYQYDLCETCLGEVMDGFAIKAIIDESE